MTDKFQDRFDLTVPLAEARERFINRIYNEIYNRLFLTAISHEQYTFFARAVATHLGDLYANGYLANFVGRDFHRNLQAIEGFFIALENANRIRARDMLSETVSNLVNDAEFDLGIQWRRGKFYPSGAKILDERLVNDVLGWIREKQYATVATPFEKGLRHLLEATKRPELTADVITDMYESLEALAKMTTGRPTRDLSANQEAFIASVKASDTYKKLLRDYITYANDFRHAMQDHKSRPTIGLKEAESFVYLTGLFIRLAMPDSD